MFALLWGQSYTMTLIKGVPSAYAPILPTTFTRTPPYYGISGPQTVTLDSTYSASSPLILISPDYNELADGTPIGRYKQTSL